MAILNVWNGSEWVRLEGRSIGGADNIPSGSNSTTSITTASYSVLKTDTHLVCTVPTTIHLQSYAERAGVLKITNMSDGAVLLQPMSGETINTHSTLTIKHKVSTVDLVPINGGYSI